MARKSKKIQEIDVPIIVEDVSDENFETQQEDVPELIEKIPGIIEEVPDILDEIVPVIENHGNDITKTLKKKIG